ncbi:DUF292-domain-containing protein [Nadsonia fulvescens var. elongata DSM 6958]|uniref:DUF292-domain-containing protein n=1 Tax=Nadsonia fulvescens var. elongata DSM 6958 TaxID=857566 RepID=A0A1E3PDC6_9ASCO|nr:DUF292-domain-containing protein [Nadsonia fulvescens var. elongata DSM 6958]
MKLKLQLKLAINRLRLIQQKETALAKQNRRLMAQLLEQGREESARIRVENIIQEDIYVELLEIIELYCELLLARISLIDVNRELDPGLEEAVRAILLAAPRTGIKELIIVRELLVLRYGKEFALSVTIDNLDNKIPKKVMSRLVVEPPSYELVTMYLREIAMAYNAPFSQLYQETKSIANKDSNDDDDDDSDGSKSGLVPVEPVAVELPEETSRARIQRRLSGTAHLPDPLDDSSKSPISLSAPKPSSDNPRPKVLVSKDIAAHSTMSRPRQVVSNSNDEELDELRKRFEALKQK